MPTTGSLGTRYSTLGGGLLLGAGPSSEPPPAPVGGSLFGQPGCNCCSPCASQSSCFRLIVCSSPVPDEAMTIAGAALDRTPTGEEETGSTGAAGEAFCHAWEGTVPPLSRVDFLWKDCNLAAYLPTAECDYSFDFDVCIARNVEVRAYDVLDDATVDDVQVCVQGRVEAAIPWDGDSSLCVPSPTVRDLYWWNVPPSYAASGLDCAMQYTGASPSAALANGLVVRTTGLIVDSSPAEYAAYVWECDKVDPWCCEDDATLEIGGLPVDDPDDLWSFAPCHSGPWTTAPEVGAWGCPPCRDAAHMAYANLNAWAKRVHCDLNLSYWRPNGPPFFSPPVREDMTFSGTLAFNCTGSVAQFPSWTSGPITASWPIGYYWNGADLSDWTVAYATQVRILFGGYGSFGPSRFGKGWIAVEFLAFSTRPTGFGAAVCNFAGLWLAPDDLDDIFVNATDGGTYGPLCDHHIDWYGAAAIPDPPGAFDLCSNLYPPTFPTTIPRDTPPSLGKAFGSASVTGPV